VNATRLSRITIEEEKKTGAFDFIQEMHKKAGIYFVGRQQPAEQDFFYMFLKKRVQKLEDFSGLKLGGSLAFHAFYRSLGASVVTLPIPEYYPAMERGVVDGISTSLHVWVHFGGAKVTKCMIAHPFYKCTATVIANLENWNRIPKHLQELITDCLSEAHKEWPKWEAPAYEKEKQQMRDGGTEIVTLPPDDAKRFVDLAYDSGWKDEEKKFGKTITELKKLTTKQ
jgi:TRAP-type C4-dicarboxylate transport system substrate-binding protein